MMVNRAERMVAPADRPFFGTPRPLPRVLLCNSTAERFCGRTWTANPMEQYDEYVKLRAAHEPICASMMAHRDQIMDSLKKPSLPFPRVTLG